MPGPVLFCYDGSPGSAAAMAAATELVARPAPAVILTIWQPAVVLLARAGGFGINYVSNEDEVDETEARLAAEVAQDGAKRAAEHGYDATAQVREATEGTGRAIIAVAAELDARLIVCGRRGLGGIAATFLGSVSHELVAHAGRPVLVAPEH
jgi:nucleotide-binding universal stress UspA family protein